MNFEDCVIRIKDKFTKKQLSEFDKIVSYDEIKLASMGHNDVEGYQVFTPEFIVKEMTEAVGNDILDFSKNVLEPTSGDGAFTVYILKKRFETIKDNYEIEMLKALSTIYSIEMDDELILKQRNNIFTLFKMFIDEKKINADISYFDLVKCMIVTNFIWAMFNSDNQITAITPDVAYKIPEASKGKYKPIDFPVWQITNDSISIHNEGVDLW